MGRVSEEEFRKRVREKYGDRYSLKKMEFVDMKTKITIVCKEHGEFRQRPSRFTSGKENGECGKCKSNNKKQNLLEQFLMKANEIHGNRYNYSKVEYIDCKTNIKIICSEHGEFIQRPDTHINKKADCPSCAGVKKKETDGFILDAKEIHKDKYDYSKTIYTNARTKITIICGKHGEFYQLPYNHLEGRGCKKCGYILSGLKRRITTEEFVVKSLRLYGDKYDYSRSVYIRSDEKVIIICKKHGEFLQRPNDHLNGYECSKCFGGVKLSQEEFIKRAIIIHENKYDYSKVIYEKGHSKIIILCKEHGKFEQTPSSHMQGHGCPSCKSSRGESCIRNFLTYRDIKFGEQKTFDDCKYRSLLKFDFYLPDFNACVEFDGIQHFKPVEHFGGEETFKEQQIKDNIKNEFCIKNSMKLLRIPYTIKLEDKNLYRIFQCFLYPKISKEKREAFLKKKNCKIF